MRELTLEELDLELAEQLPSRELMGSCAPSPCKPCGGGVSVNIAIAIAVSVNVGGPH